MAEMQGRAWFTGTAEEPILNLDLPSGPRGERGPEGPAGAANVVVVPSFENAPAGLPPGTIIFSTTGG